MYRYAKDYYKQIMQMTEFPAQQDGENEETTTNKHKMNTRKLNKGWYGSEKSIDYYPFTAHHCNRHCGIAAYLPKHSMKVIDTLWNIFVNKLGFFYILLGFGLVCTAFYLAFQNTEQSG